MDETEGKASFDDLFQIALSLDDGATKEDINHTWLLLAHYICAMGSKIEHIHRVVSDVQAVRTASRSCRCCAVPFGCILFWTAPWI